MTSTTRELSLTSAQMEVLNDLLDIGGERPVAAPDLAGRLNDHIERGVAGSFTLWDGDPMWIGKAHLAAVRRCEGNVLATADMPRLSVLPTPTAVGIVTHRAVQMAYTLPSVSPAELVRMAIAGSMNEDAFSAFYRDASEWERVDFEAQAVNTTVGWLDLFPPLQDAWVPRFDVQLSQRFTHVTLAGRPDLSLGRPRGDGRQTMVLCDIKTGSLHDGHEFEGRFYALLATLRNGVPPFRSTVLSIADGMWTPPEVTEDILFATADEVIAGINARVELLRAARTPTLTAGPHCRWCPVNDTCEAADRPERDSAEPQSTPITYRPGTTRHRDDVPAADSREESIDGDLSSSGNQGNATNNPYEL